MTFFTLQAPYLIIYDPEEAEEEYFTTRRP